MEKVSFNLSFLVIQLSFIEVKILNEKHRTETNLGENVYFWIKQILIYEKPTFFQKF